MVHTVIGKLPTELGLMKPFIVKSSALALTSNAVNMPVRVISVPVIAIVAPLSQFVMQARIKSDAEAGK